MGTGNSPGPWHGESLAKETPLKKIIDYLRSQENLSDLVGTIHANRRFYEQDRIRSKDALLIPLRNMFVAECVKANQYVRIGEDHSLKVGELYRILVDEIQGLLPGSFAPKAILGVVERHRRRLIELLFELDGDQSSGEIIPCAEYSEAFQKSILRLEQRPLAEPILDVGCGRAYSLVKALRLDGHRQVFGLDQYVSDRPFIFHGSWLEWDFQPQSWGTILSHMAFSNHCRNAVHSGHHEGPYRQKYFEILRALKGGGAFIYTPRVAPFEDSVDGDEFEIAFFANSDDRDLDTVVIRKRD